MERRKPGREAAGEPALARGAREGAGLERCEQLAERELLAADGEAPGLQAGDVQRGAEEIDQLDRLPLERGADVALLGGERAEGAFAEQARVADQRVERCAQVVRHGRERVALHACEPGEPPALPRVDQRHAGEGGERKPELEPRVGERCRPGDHQVERAGQVRTPQGQHDAAHGHAAVRVVQHQRPAAPQGGREHRLAHRLAVVARPVLGPEAVGGEEGIEAVLEHPDRGAGHAEEEGGPLHQPLGQRLGVAAHQEQVALQVHELLDPEGIEGRHRLRPGRGGQLIFLLLHGWGRM